MGWKTAPEWRTCCRRGIIYLEKNLILKTLPVGCQVKNFLATEDTENTEKFEKKRGII